MGGLVMNDVQFDFSDVQGLVRFGYGKMPRARYELLRIKNPIAARAWLRDARVTTAVAMEPPPDTAMNVAFTAPGLLALGVPPAVIDAFSHEFRTGMAEPSRARQLGDVGDNAPGCWHWGTGNHEPHLVVMFFGKFGVYEDFLHASKGDLWKEAFELVGGEPLRTCNLDGIEPFGFTDGISQPEVDWDSKRKATHAAFEYTNWIAPGELLLGYPNEYGKITDRPLLEPDAASRDLLPAIDDPGKKDVGRNGSYLVMRHLEQDVRKFWTFMYEQSAGEKDGAEALAASMVGRTRLGKPLVPPEDQPISGIPSGDKINHFTYAQDPHGSRCPFGAHLRRANPRNADYPNRPSNVFMKLLTMLGFGPRGFRDDLMSSVRFHRIVRRGREFGSGLSPEDAMRPPPADEEPRGIHFICLNGNISRQFEFLQNAWMAGTKFSGLTGESDPLTGTRQPIPGCPVTSNFTLQSEDGLSRKLTGLPQFVTLRGGAYFFMPGIKALRYFAEVGELQ